MLSSGVLFSRVTCKSKCFWPVGRAWEKRAKLISDHRVFAFPIQCKCRVCRWCEKRVLSRERKRNVGREVSISLSCQQSGFYVSVRPRQFPSNLILENRSLRGLINTRGEKWPPLFALLIMSKYLNSNLIFFLFLFFEGVIAISWIMSCKISMVRKQLKATRKLQLKRFKVRAKVRLNYYMHLNGCQRRGGQALSALDWVERSEFNTWPGQCVV